jgi:hypothetical protein
MGWREFTVEMTKAVLALPVLVTVLALVFRRKIGAGLAQIGAWLAKHRPNVTVGPVSIAWAEQAVEVANDLEAAGVPSPAPGGTAPLPGLVAEGHATVSDPSLVDRYSNTAKMYPIGAVMEASTAIERRLREILTSAGVGTGATAAATRSMTVLAQEAASAGLITKETANSVVGLARLRNLAAHGGEVSPERAAEFLALADATLYAINQNAEPSRQQ